MNIVRFSPDGELFCTGSADCKAFLFNGKTAEQVGPLGGDKAHSGGIYGVSRFIYVAGFFLNICAVTGMGKKSIYMYMYMYIILSFLSKRLEGLQGQMHLKVFSCTLCL